MKRIDKRTGNGTATRNKSDWQKDKKRNDKMKGETEGQNDMKRIDKMTGNNKQEKRKRNDIMKGNGMTTGQEETEPK